MAKKTIPTGPIIAREKLNAEAALRKVQRRTEENQTFRGATENFRMLEISGVTFKGENLNNTDFSFSALKDVVFCGCLLGNAKFWFAEIQNVKFIECEAQNLEFHHCILEKLSFFKTVLDCSKFDFSEGDATFENCQMECCEFPSIDMVLTFKHTNAERSEFNGCKLLTLNAQKSNFTRCEMNNSLLKGSFDSCNLTFSEWAGSNCRALQFTNTILRELRTDENTVGMTEENTDR